MEGNLLTEDERWKKLPPVVDIVSEVWDKAMETTHV
jgi:hypothetical protein